MKICTELSIIEQIITEKFETDKAETLLSLGTIDAELIDKLMTKKKGAKSISQIEPRVFMEPVYRVFSSCGAREEEFSQLPNYTGVAGLDIKNLSPTQRLLLAIYVHFWALVKGESLSNVSVLENTRNMLGITNAFVPFLLLAVKKTSYIDWITPGKILNSILNPSDPMTKWVHDLTYKAIEDGSFIRKKSLPGLRRFEYEHPRDRAGYEKVSKTPGMERLLRKLNEYSIDRINRVQCTGSHLKVTQENFPRIYRALLSVCDTLEYKALPELYVEQGFLNSSCVGVQQPSIIITTGCISSLSYDELLFILGHEVGHLKSEHILYHQIAKIFPIVAELLDTVTLGFGSLFSSGLHLMLLNWYRMSEFTADRAGLIACQNYEAALLTLTKLAGAPQKYYNVLNTEDVIKQAREFEDYDMDKITGVAKNLAILKNDQPWTIMRIREIDQWYRDGQFAKIMRVHVN